MKQKLIFATLREKSGAPAESYVFRSWRAYFTATFSPDCEVVAVHPLALHGRTYRERQGSLRDLAIDIQCDDVGGLSSGELWDMEAWFEEQGRRYGLLREFRGNAIC